MTILQSTVNVFPLHHWKLPNSSKPFPQGSLGTWFLDIKGIIVTSSYHAMVNKLACEIYELSERCHSPFGLPGFAKVRISKIVDCKLEENGFD